MAEILGPGEPTPIETTGTMGIIQDPRRTGLSVQEALAAQIPPEPPPRRGPSAAPEDLLPLMERIRAVGDQTAWEKLLAELVRALRCELALILYQPDTVAESRLLFSVGLSKRRRVIYERYFQANRAPTADAVPAVQWPRERSMESRGARRAVNPVLLPEMLRPMGGRHALWVSLANGTTGGFVLGVLAPRGSRGFAANQIELLEALAPKLARGRE